MASDTYEQPADGWVCFHCGERFTKPGTAENHFGPTPNSVAACVLSVESRGFLMDLRKRERDLDESKKKDARARVRALIYRAALEAGGIPIPDVSEAMADVDGRFENGRYR